MTPEQKEKKRLQQKAYREKHRERLNEISRLSRKKRKAELGDYWQETNQRWRQNNPQKYLWMNAKKTARERGHEFDLEPEDIHIPNTCPVFGFPIQFLAGRMRQPDSPSIDRIDHRKGYIKGNVQVISWRANHLKSDGTLEEFKELVRFLENG